MSAIITEKFRAHNANQFYESFTEASASTYYGTPQSKEDFKAWQTPDGKLGVSYESSDSPSFEVILAIGNALPDGVNPKKAKYKSSVLKLF